MFRRSESESERDERAEEGVLVVAGPPFVVSSPALIVVVALFEDPSIEEGVDEPIDEREEFGREELCEREWPAENGLLGIVAGKAKNISSTGHKLVGD